jgi:hypothetical protein
VGSELDRADQAKSGSLRDVEQLGAGSGNEGFETLPENLLELG